MTDVRRFPEDFLLKIQKLLGEEYGQYLKSFKEEQKSSLRVNTWKIDPRDLAKLMPWNLEPVSWIDNGFYYDGSLKGEALRSSKYSAYYAGLYYLQEPSVMTLVTTLPVVPGDRVLDLCAVPGGKSMELASKLKDCGMFVSNDTSYPRARVLLKNLELVGTANICVTSEASGKLAYARPEYLDEILVDAPCFREGMFRRDEDMVKDQKKKGLEYYVPIQRQILSQVAAVPKLGGYTMYSIYTLSVEEDEGNVSYILEEFPQMELCCLDLDKVPGVCGGFGLSGCVRLFPHCLGGEGHFLALMRKKGGDDGEARTEHGGVRGTADKGIFRSMDKGILPPIDPGTVGKRARAVEKEKELDAFLGQNGVEWDYGRIVIHQGNAYYLPEGLAWNLSLRFLRTGLFLGEFKKGRLEPPQALAMSMKAGQFPNTVNSLVGDSQVLRYLKGEIISLEVDEGSVRGWCLAAMEGFPPGWVKGTGMSLKNKYYPDWRWQQQSGPEMAAVKQAMGRNKMMADKDRKNGPMRLDRSLAEMGYGTRIQVRDMVKRGRGRVNAEAVKDADRKVGPEPDLTKVGRSQVAYARMKYYMLNKSQGVVSAIEDRKYPTVVGLIRKTLGKDLSSVGRLDIDTEGPLLITSDGGLVHNLLSPKKHVYKVYLAHASGGLLGDAVRRFEEGIKLEDGTMTLPVELKIQEAAGREKEWQEVLTATREGKLHQIKRVFEALGCRVEYLKWVSMGPLMLDPELKPGEYRPLAPEEEYFIKDCENRGSRI